MVFAIITTILACIITSTLTQSSFVDRYPPFPLLNPDYPESQMEEETEYVSLTGNEGPDFDWSPPNGELPNDKITSGDLSSYFGDGDEEDGGMYLRESWIQPDNINGDLGRVEAKRAFDFPRRKKNQVLCRVQRAIHHHSEVGHEFFPKSYTSYSCTPVSGSQLEGSVATNHDTCYVPGDNCITIEKEQLFLRRKRNTNCWGHFIEAVGAGCKCLSRKY